MDMKKILFPVVISFCLLFSGKLYAQEMTDAYNLPIDPDSKKIVYREVVNENEDPGYLYNKAIEWFNYYYLSPTSVFNVQDKVNGKIEGTGRMGIFYQDKDGNKLNAGVISYSILLEFKENRYRFTITDFNLKGGSRFPIEKWLNKEDPAYNPQWNEYLYQIDTTMQRLTSTLIEKMKPVAEKKDEW